MQRRRPAGAGRVLPLAGGVGAGHISGVLRPQLPPYSVEPATFRFPALAALAGKLPLGSGREAVLSALLAARLAAQTLHADADGSALAARAAAARDWFRALCPDAKVRAACTAVADATAGGPGGQSDAEAVARALHRLAEVAGRHLDAAARAELETLARRAHDIA